MVAAGDPVAALHLGVMGERVAADAALTARLLADGIRRAPRDDPLYAEAHLYLAAARARTGALTEARELYASLARNTAFPAPLRDRAAAALAALPNR